MDIPFYPARLRLNAGGCVTVTGFWNLPPDQRALLVAALATAAVLLAVHFARAQGGITDERPNWGPLFTLLLIAAVIALAKYRPKYRGSGTNFGTASFCTEAALRRAGMLSGDGLPIGRTRRGKLIRLNRFTHLSIFAPTGAGKAVSFSVPWLLTYRRGSVVVVDPKGELYQLTAARRRAMGQKVYRLDPFGVCGPGGDASNILDLIMPGPECVDAIRPLAEAMVVRPPEGDRDPHWGDQAANVITALLTLVVMQLPPEDRNLSSLRDLIADPDTPKDAPGILRSKGGIFARLGGVMAQLEDKERAGVFSTVHRHTTFLDSPAIMAATNRSTFDMRELLKGNVTLYLILPPAQLEQSRWLRLVIASLIRLIGQEGMAKGKECLMLLDEAGQLGHMAPLEQGLTLLRGYGLKMAFFFQSLGQLKSVFRDKESVLLDNTEQIYFGTQSLETAERVSKMLGDATIMVESANEGDSTNWGSSQGHDASVQRSRNYGRNLAEAAASLLKPDEVMTLHHSYVVIFLRGIPPLLCGRIFWYADPAFRAAKRLSLAWWLLLAGAQGLVAWALLK